MAMRRCVESPAVPGFSLFSMRVPLRAKREREEGEDDEGFCNRACLCVSAVLNGSSHSPTALNGAPSTPNGFSNGPAGSSTAALPTQQLPPACGARQLCKLKRFLTTLQQFGNDISPEIGERVRSLVLGLVVSLTLCGCVYLCECSILFRLVLNLCGCLFARGGCVCVCE